MDDMHQQALHESERLSQMSDDALFHELGLRIEDSNLPGGEERKKHYSGEFLAADTTMGTGILAEIGRRWWSSLEPQLMQLLCDTNNQEIKELTGGNKSIPALAAGLAVSALAAIAAPSVVIVVSSIIALKISESGLKAVCDTWAEHSKAE